MLEEIYIKTSHIKIYCSETICFKNEFIGASEWLSQSNVRLLITAQVSSFLALVSSSGSGVQALRWAPPQCEAY